MTAKCLSDNCPKEGTCYRKLAVDDPIDQEWKLFKPGNKCEGYIEMPKPKGKK